jgi:hypothetical protein
MKNWNYFLLVSVLGLFLFCDNIENSLNGNTVLNYTIPKGNYSVSSFFCDISGDTVSTMKPRCSYEISKFVKKSDNEKLSLKLQNDLLIMSSLDSTVFGISIKRNNPVTITFNKSTVSNNSAIGLWSFKSFSFVNDADSLLIPEKLKNIKWLEIKKSEMYCYYETSKNFSDEFQLYFNQNGFCENITLEKITSDSIIISSKTSSDSIKIVNDCYGNILTLSNNKSIYTDYKYSELSFDCPNDKYPSWLIKEFKTINCK